jgi:hypothetical protein
MVMKDYFGVVCTLPAHIFVDVIKWGAISLYVVQACEANCQIFTRPRNVACLIGFSNHEYTMEANDIYPSWPTFVMTITNPQGEKQSQLSVCQEAWWKDIERASCVLQAWFSIVWILIVSRTRNTSPLSWQHV